MLRIDRQKKLGLNNKAGGEPPLSTTATDTTSNSSYRASPSSSQATSLGQASTGSDQLTQAASPGLLTVKIYGSQNIQLPIKINNTKQILHALAINANNESVGQKLLKICLRWKNTEIGDYLPGSIATNFLPSIITIPNAENMVKSLLYLTIEFDNNVLVIEPQRGTVNQSTWNQVVSFDVSKNLNRKMDTRQWGLIFES